MFPELGRSVVGEVAAHGRIFPQISCKLCSDVRSVSQCFSLLKSKIMTVVLSVFPLPHCETLSDVHYKHKQPRQMMILVKKYGVLG